MTASHLQSIEGYCDLIDKVTPAQKEAETLACLMSVTSLYACGLSEPPLAKTLTLASIIHRLLHYDCIPQLLRCGSIGNTDVHVIAQYMGNLTELRLMKTTMTFLPDIWNMRSASGEPILPHLRVLYLGITHHAQKPADICFPCISKWMKAGFFEPRSMHTIWLGLRFEAQPEQLQLFTHQMDAVPATVRFLKHAGSERPTNGNILTHETAVHKIFYKVRTRIPPWRFTD